MALTCLLLRRLLHRSRDALSNAERLELEAHLEACRRCAAEVDTIEEIRALIDRVPGRPLGQQRIARAIDRAFVSAAEQGGDRAAAPRRRTWMIASALAVPVATAAVLLWWAGAGSSQPASDRVIHGEVRAEGRTLMASAHVPGGVSVLSSEDATLALGPARVELGPHTAVRWNPDTYTLQIEQGHLDLSIESTPQRRFRVSTHGFIVEVVGTRFQVTLDRVEVTHGVVRILTADSSALITELRDGESWSAAPPAPSPLTRAPATAQERAARDEMAPPRDRKDPAGTGARPTAGRSGGSATRPDATHWLTRARGALAQGDLDDARDAARATLAASSSREQAAEARTILAECAQAAGEPAEAIRLYLAIARRYPDLRAGETALFAAARLEANRGRTDESRALLRGYVRAYPDGQFAGDARSRLRALGEATDHRDHGCKETNECR
jgi:ferric-dicitrate binding protein FerR (iron transport regulator)